MLKLDAEDRLGYKEHRRRLKTIEHHVDNEAPRLNVQAYFSSDIYSEKKEGAKRLFNENRKLVQEINKIYRTRKGPARSPAEIEISRKLAEASAIIRKQALDEIARDNKVFRNILKTSTSSYSVKEYNELWKKILPELHLENIITDPQKNWNIAPLGIMTNPVKRNICYFDVVTDDMKLGRMEIEIYSDVVPESAENFVSLCKPNNQLTYEKCKFFRIIPGLFCIGGDVANNNGLGTASIYGDSFPQENFSLNHSCPGVVSLFSMRLNFNSSQFLITFRKMKTLDNKFVVIGRVIKSLKVLQMIEEFGSSTGKPKKNVRIENCGVLK